MRFFIVCPANFASGGPELLHQFSECLTKKGIENYLIYLHDAGMMPTSCPTPESYLKYDVQYISDYIDAPDSILVLPETQIHYVNLCQLGTALIWWLSVDNYMKIYNISSDNYDIFNLKKRRNVVHAVQSYYAKQFLNIHFEIQESYMLGDYINDEIMDISNSLTVAQNRENICLYNPRKGYENLKPIISSCRKDIRWIPLSGLTPQELAYLMCHSKVYIDFGNHPGKDRIPREAAICGCCIITNMQGSAAYQEDVMIPDKYKIADMENIDAVHKIIYDCIDNYEIETKNFYQYRLTISQEKQSFQYEIDTLLNLLHIVIESKAIIPAHITDTLLSSYTTIEHAFFKSRDLLLKSKQAYETGQTNNTVQPLLQIDYILSLIRENIYSQINHMVSCNPKDINMFISECTDTDNE